MPRPSNGMRTPRLLLAALALAACSSNASRTAMPAATAAPAQVLPSAEDVAIREQTADQQIRQALARLTFGARPGDVEQVRTVGVDRWIATQLDPARIDDRADERVLTEFPTLAMSSADLIRDYPPPQPKHDRDSLDLRRIRSRAQRVVLELQIAKVARAVNSDRQLQEVMVDFWDNHFNIFAGKGVPERYMLASFERDAIRPNALGRFRDLLGTVAKSPAMLFYLDNWESTVEAGRPAFNTATAMRARRASAYRLAPAPRRLGLNENYGRELLELHTLGVDGGYTQADVIAAARAFTGWTIDKPRQLGSFVFRPAMHDAGEKVFLGHSLHAGRGIQDGEDVLDIIARSPATAHFIATKLARRFVSDSPPPALVDRAAATFARTDGDIRETLRTIFTSPEFFSRAAYKVKVKSPFELVVSALRAVCANPDSTARTAQIVARLGEPLYMHRDPNGYPETGDAWINTGSILSRINFGLLLAAGRVPGVSLSSWEHRQGLDTLSRDAQVDGVINAILGGEASPDSRLLLQSGVNPLLRDAPDSAAGAPMTVPGLEQLVGLALGAPEFQRR